MNQSVIELKDLRKSYGEGESKARVLKGINLTVNKGDFVAIMGQSGSGKSTLVNIIGLLAKPSSGKYRLAGRSVDFKNQDKLDKLRGSRIGFVFQDYILIDHLNVLENVLLPLAFDNRSTREKRNLAYTILKKLGLKDKLFHLPRQLSGGQKQRVSIARALMIKPKLLLADEPAGALDEETKADLLKLLQKLNSNGVTILMITHSDNDASYAKRIIRIQDGRLLASE